MHPKVLNAYPETQKPHSRSGGDCSVLTAHCPIPWLTWSRSQTLSFGCSLVGSQKLRQEAGTDDQVKTENPKPNPSRWALRGGGVGEGGLRFCRLLSPAVPGLSPRGPQPWIPPCRLLLFCPPARPTPACFLPCLADLPCALLGRRPRPASSTI